jgi:PIN domain nuclease of toxin-antitoxin system
VKVLLDTHAFLWWITDDPRISSRARDVVQDAENELYLSAASGWEIAIKTQLGRLQLPGEPDVYLTRQMSVNAIRPLAITMRHSLFVYGLPDIHKDPFDRMIVAQSILEEMHLLTKDGNILKYGIQVIW